MELGFLIVLCWMILKSPLSYSGIRISLEHIVAPQCEWSLKLFIPATSLKLASILSPKKLKATHLSFPLYTPGSLSSHPISLLLKCANTTHIVWISYSRSLLIFMNFTFSLAENWCDILNLTVHITLWKMCWRRSWRSWLPCTIKLSVHASVQVIPRKHRLWPMYANLFKFCSHKEHVSDKKWSSVDLFFCSAWINYDEPNYHWWWSSA